MNWCHQFIVSILHFLQFHIFLQFVGKLESTLKLIFCPLFYSGSVLSLLLPKGREEWSSMVNGSCRTNTKMKLHTQEGTLSLLGFWVLFISEKLLSQWATEMTLENIVWNFYFQCRNFLTYRGSTIFQLYMRQKQYSSNGSHTSDSEFWYFPGASDLSYFLSCDAGQLQCHSFQWTTQSQG